VLDGVIALFSPWLGLDDARRDLLAVEEWKPRDLAAELLECEPAGRSCENHS
jgi:hypothetical protein